MHINKHFLFVVGVPAFFVAVIIFASMYRFYATGGIFGVNSDRSPADEMGIDTELIDPIEGYGDRRIMNPDSPTGMDEDGIESAVFTGTLTHVDTGCFADGECYIDVDGNHVTAIMGWSREVVGTVRGVKGFGDLEAHIGEQVEVYARKIADRNYSLYGNEAYYIRLAGGVDIDAPDYGSGPTTGGGTSGSGGMTGVGSITVTEPYPANPGPAQADGCMVGGCSSQLCFDSSMGDMASTCEWREEYACYQSATCERQANGQCGWTETAELNQCLSGASETDEPVFIVQ